MTAMDRLLQDFLAAYEKVKGAAARKNLQVRWTGGTQVVIRNIEANRTKLVDIGTLRLMTDQLSKAA